MGKFGNTQNVIDAEKEQRVKALQLQKANAIKLALEKREEMLNLISLGYRIDLEIYKLKRGLE